MFFTTIALAEQVQIETPKNKQFATIAKGMVNKKRVKKGDTLKFSFTITDNGIEKINEYLKDDFDDNKEFREVEFRWQSQKKQTISKIYCGTYNRKTETFKISDKIKISKGMQQGLWKLQAIIIYSGSVYGEDGSESVVICNSAVKKNEETYLNSIKEFVDLSFADFTVKGTGKKLDKEGPAISTKSLKLSKRVLKKGTFSKFSVKVKEQSGMIYRMTCQWTYYGKYGDPDGEEIVYEMKYNKKKKVYECYIPMDLSDWKAKLRFIDLQDCYGNERQYYWHDDKEEKAISSWGRDFNGKYKKYSLKKKDKKALKEMVITRKKKYIKK